MNVLTKHEVKTEDQQILYFTFTSHSLPLSERRLCALPLLYIKAQTSQIIFASLLQPS